MAGLKRAVVVVIGNEVLSGRTRDANVSYIGERLAALGVTLAEARIIPDLEPVIIETLNHCRQRFDYVFTTGGIGPTHDDITAAAVAKAFGVALIRDPRAEALLRQHYKPEDLNAARLKMADIPEGADLIENPVSKAPGFRLGNVFVMAGVPRIAQAMFENVAHLLVGGPPMLSKTVAAYLPEGLMAEGLGAIQAGHAGVDIGSYPFARDGRLGASLVVRGRDDREIAQAAEAIRQLIRSLGGEPIEDLRVETRFD